MNYMKITEQEIERNLYKLRPRQAEIIILYYGLNGKQALNIHEIAKELNVTRSCVIVAKDLATERLKGICNL